MSEPPRTTLPPRPTWTTLQPGPTLVLTAPLTREQFVALLADLCKEFGEVFEPEAITEGGILWKTQNYKSMRFSGFKGPGYRMTRLNWPPISPNVVDVWQHDTTILLPAGKLLTYLKAQDKSWWSREDLDGFAKVFALHNITLLRRGRSLRKRTKRDTSPKRL